MSKAGKLSRASTAMATALIAFAIAFALPTMAYASGEGEILSPPASGEGQDPPEGDLGSSDAPSGGADLQGEADAGTQDGAGGAVSGDSPGEGDLVEVGDSDMDDVNAGDGNGGVVDSEVVGDGSGNDTADKATAGEAAGVEGGNADAGKPADSVASEEQKTAKYVVTLVTDGAVLATLEVESGQSAELPAPAGKDGYTFAGWSTSAGATGAAFTATIDNVTADTTLFAVWVEVAPEPEAPNQEQAGKQEETNTTRTQQQTSEAKQQAATQKGAQSNAQKTTQDTASATTKTSQTGLYTVTMMVNGEAYETVKVENGKDASLLWFGSRHGEKFAGWAIEPGGKAVYTATNLPASSILGDTTLYAVWGGGNTPVRLRTAAQTQTIESAFSGAAVKGNLVMDSRGTLNPGAWWAYYTTEQDVSFNGQTYHVLPKSLLVGAFNDADSKEVYTKYYVSNTNLWKLDGTVSFSNTGKGYSTMPWYITSTTGTKVSAGASNAITLNTEYVRTFGGIQPVYMLCGWFQGWKDWAFKNVKEFHMDGLDVVKCESLAVAFYDTYHSCELTGFANWDTSNVKTFQLMFAQSFTKSDGSLVIDIRNWDMTNAVSFKEMWKTSFSNKSLNGLVLGQNCVLQNSMFNNMGKGIWRVEEIIEAGETASNFYVGLTIDQDGLESFYRSGGNTHGTIRWGKLGSNVTTYKVTYNKNGGTGTVATSYATYGSNVVLPPNAVTLKSQLFTKTGQRIKEWNTNGKGTGTSYKLGSELRVTGNITLYAIWEEADGFWLKYDVDGGTPTYPDMTTMPNGTLIKWSSSGLIPSTSPTKPNYTFSGWYVVNSKGEWTNQAGRVQTKPTLRAYSSTAYSGLAADSYNDVPVYLKAYWVENDVTVKYATNPSSQAKVKLTGASGTGSATASETKKPVSVGFAGATATVSAGYHSVGWTNTLYPNKTIAGTSSFDANEVETNVLSPNAMKSVLMGSDGVYANNVTFTLMVAGNEFTLHFNPNFTPDGTYDFIYSSIGNIDMRYGDTMYLPTVYGSYRRDEYVFQDAWANAPSREYAEQNGITYKEYSTASKFAESAIRNGTTYELYAVWKMRMATATFRADYPEGYVVQNYGTDNEVNYDKKDWVQTFGIITGTVEDATAVAHPGYRFLYWIDDVTKTVVSTNPTWKPIKTGKEWPLSMAYRAKYEPITYQIAFDANEGYGTMENQDAVYGRTVTLRANALNKSTGNRLINNDGYIFSGWNTQANGSGKSYKDQGQVRLDSKFLELLGADGQTVTLYAMWKPRPITVRYNAGAPGVSNAAAYTQKAAHEVEFQLKANSFNRYGYEFEGWAYSLGGAKAFEDKAENVKFNVFSDGSEINLYALWNPKTWTVTFANSNEEFGSYAVPGLGAGENTIEVQHKDSVSVEPSASPIGDHYFMGWKYSMKTSGATRSGILLYGEVADFEVLGDVTLTATWGPSGNFVRYLPGKHGLFKDYTDAAALHYTYWTDVKLGASFYPEDAHGQGGYTYNGGVDSASTNPANVGHPLGEPGWVFDYWSWYDERNIYRTTLTSSLPTTVKTSYTFVAHWKADGLTLSFDPNGGEPAEEDSLESVPAGTGEKYTLPDESAVIRTGYRFLGWGSEADGGIEYLGGEEITVPDTNTILYAIWDPFLLVVRFDTQGGSPVDDSIGLTWESINLLKDQADPNYLSAIDDALDVATTKPGFKFAGWFVDAGNTAAHLRVTNANVLGKLFADFVGENGPEDGDVFTLYAAWTPIKSTLHFIPVYEDGIGGTEALSNSATRVKPKTTETVEAAYGVPSVHTAVAGKGYAFLYWADADGNILGTDAEFTPEKGVYDPDTNQYEMWGHYDYDENGELVWVGDVWYYAVFAPVVYKIAFDANGGSGTFEDVELEYAQVHTLPANENNDMYNPGYAFMGWYTEDEYGTRTYYAAGSKVSKLTEEINGVVIMYARWELADQTITFHDNYNDPESTKKFDVVHGQKVYLPNDTSFTRDHYKLTSWNTKADGTGTNYAPGRQFTVPTVKEAEDGTRNLDLYAIWSGIVYMVHFNANAAEATGTMSDQSHEYGKEQELTANAYKRQGYTFIGWAYDQDATTADFDDEKAVSNLSEIEGDVVQLYAVWQANEYIVSFSDGDVAFADMDALDQTVKTGESVVYDGTTVAFTTTGDQQLAGWTYVVYADDGETVIDSGSTLFPDQIKIIGRTVFTARWTLPYQVQYLPGTQGDFESWTSDVLVEGAEIPWPWPDAESGYTIIDENTNKPKAKSNSYVFAGWRDQNGKTYADYDAIKEALKVTPSGWIFEAQWKGVEASLDFDANNGTWTTEDEQPPAPVTGYLHGEEIDLPGDVVSRQGYTFDGWSDKSDDTGTVYAPGSKYTLDKAVETLYAHWVPKHYTVYYDMGAAPAVTHDTGVTWDDMVAKVESGWVSGEFFDDHVFAGWASTPGATVPDLPLSYKVLGADGLKTGELLELLGYTNDDPRSVTLYAVWTLPEVTIVYYSKDYHGTVTIKGHDSGSTGYVEESFSASGTPVGAIAEPAEGYKFLGWYDKEADDEEGEAGLITTNPTFIPGKGALSYWVDKAYWAWFDPISYTVVFDPNSANAAAASSGMAPQIMKYDLWEPLSARYLQIVNPGYSFKEWNSKPDGTGIRYNDEQMVANLSKVDGDTVTLYAQWVFGDYRVVFDKNADDAVGTMPEQPMQYGTASNLLKNEYKRNGYKLLGWAADSTATVQDYLDEASFKLTTGDPETTYTLYAVWAIADNYILRFENDETDKGAITDTTGVVAAGNPIERTVTFNVNPNITDIGVTPVIGWGFAGWNITTYLYNDSPRGYYTVESQVISKDWKSINEWVVSGYLTVAKPIWAEAYRVTFDPGAHGTFSKTVSDYFASGDLVPTIGQVLSPSDLAAALWTAPSGDAYNVTTLRADDDSKFAFAYWQDEFTMQRYYSYDSLEGLTFGNADISLVAVWVDAYQRINYQWLGYEPKGSVTNPVSARAHTAVTLYDEQDIKRDERNLVGWSTTPYGERVYAPGQVVLMPTEGLTLYAIWQEHTVIIRYKVASEDLDKGRVAGPGMRKMEDGTLFQEIGATTGFVYDANGNVVSRTPFAAYANPNAGYVFTVWMKEDTHDNNYQAYGSTPFVVSRDIFTSSIYTDATFWATFKPANEKTIQYEISLVGVSADSGVNPADAGWLSLTIEYVDADKGLATGSTAYAKDGWEFDGWYIKNGERLTLQTHDAYFVPTKAEGTVWPENSVFYAVFKASDAINYTVEHWLEDENGIYVLLPEDDPDNPVYTETRSAAYGATVTAASKSFDGWTYNAKASAATKSGKLDGTEALTLVLYYSRNRYKVTYEYEDGIKPYGAISAPSPAEYRQGETVTVEAKPSFDGWTFTGWTVVTDGGYTEVTINDDGTFVMPNGKVLLRGTWEAISNTIQFDPNGGEFVKGDDGKPVEAVQPRTAIPGTTLVLPTSDHVEWAGRVLVGWSLNPAGPLDFTAGQSIYMPNDLPGVHKTFYAIWREQTVKVQFDQVVRTNDGDVATPSDMLSPYNGASFVIENGKYVMMIGAVTGKVYYYNNPAREQNATPFEMEAAPLDGYALLRWEDKDVAADLGNANVYGIVKGEDGLYHAQTITAVFVVDEDITMRFELITDKDKPVNSTDIALDNPSNQVMSPVSGVPQTVTVRDMQGADKTYTFVGWYMQLTDADGNPLAKSPRQLVSTSFDVTPQKGAAGLYENATYYAVFHEVNEGMGSFKVEHYFQGLDGNYPSAPEYTVVQWEDVDKPAIADVMSVTGFTLDPATVLRGADVTAGDTGIVLKVYYTRNKHTVTFAYTGVVPTGAPLLPYDIVDVMYGADVPVPAVGMTMGHTFVGWTSSDATVITAADGSQSFTMPDSDVVLTGYFEGSLYDVIFTADSDMATVSGDGILQNVRFNTKVLMANPSTGAAWVVVTPTATNTKVQYGWNYTVTNDTGLTSGSTWVLDPSTVSVAGKMVFTANWIDGYTVTYLIGDAAKGKFTEGAGLTVFGGLTPDKEIAKWAAYNSDLDADGKPLAQPGYAFRFWQWGSGAAIFTSDKYPMPTYADADYTFTAIWEALEHTLSFDVNGGTWTSTDPNDPSGTGATGVTVLANNSTNLPGDPTNPSALATRAGYHILGWGEAADGSAIYKLGESYTMTDADKMLFLIWEEDAGINIYYIAGDGGTVTLPTEQVKAATKSGIGSTATPKSGRVFKEWVLWDDVNNVAIKSLVSGATLVPDPAWFDGGVITEGMTFKAIFEEDTNKVTISYVAAVLDASGKVYVGPNEVGGYVLIDSEDILPVSGTPTGTMAIANKDAEGKKYEYRLLYWLDADGNIVPPDFSSNEVYTGSVMPQRNADGAYESTTYTAVFKKIAEVVITLDGNDGDDNDAVVVPGAVKVTGGVDTNPSKWNAVDDTDLGSLGNKVERPGYTFLGWSVNKDNTEADPGLEYNSTSWTAPTSDTTLYAIWQQNADATVTLEAGDGDFVDGETVTKQATHTAPAGSIVAVVAMPQPTREGYAFAGWSETQGAKTPDADLAADDTTWAMKATTLYAVWTERDDVKFTVQYDLYRDGVFYKTHSTDDSRKGTTGQSIDATTWAITIDGYGLATTQDDASSTIAADGSTVVKLRYDAKKLTLTVVLDDGAALKSGVTNPQGQYFPDDVVSLPTSGQIDRAGYTFDKWELTWTDAAGITQTATYDPSVAGQQSFGMPAFDATLTALWNKATDTQYAIEYYKVINGTVASAPFATTTDTGTTGDPIDAMTHYYTIYKVGAQIGYALRDAAAQSEAAGTIGADGKTVLKVYFDALSHTLTYYENGGAFRPGVKTKLTVYTDEVVPLIVGTDMIPPLALFEGWWTSALTGSAKENGITPYVTDYTVGNGDVDLYAVWAPLPKVTIILIAGGGKFENGLNSEGYSSADSLPVVVSDMPQPEWTGYTLLGWSETQNSPTVDENLGLGDVWTAKAVTLYAVWKAHTDTKYAIEYYQVVDGTVASSPFKTYAGKDASGTVIDAIEHAYTKGLAVPSGYTMRAGQTVSAAIEGDGSTVLVVYYDADEQPFTIDLDGGSMSGFTFRKQAGDEPSLTASYVTDSTVTLPNKGNMSKYGYELKNWTVTFKKNGSTTATSTVDPGGTFTTPAQVVEIKANWDSTMSSYTVNHIKRFENGTSVELTVPITALTGTQVSLDNKDFDLIALQGFTYDTNSVSSGMVKADGSLVIDLYYDAITYTVTYDLGSGITATWTGHETLPYVVNAWAGKVIAIEGATNAPERAGYNFLGWTRTAGATEADSDLTPGASFTVGAANYVFSAVWKAFDVVLSFAGGSDEYITETPVTGSKADINTMVDEIVSLGDVDFVRPGYTFDGWYLDSDPTTLYSGNFTVPTASKDGEVLTLTAKWTPKEYTINYIASTDENGRKAGTVASITFRWGELDAEKMNFKPAKLSGYDFVKWYTNSLGRRGKEITDTTTYSSLVANDGVTTLNVYAIASAKIYTFNFKSTGSADSSLTFKWEATVAPPYVNQPGYKFVQWYSNSLGRRGKALADGMKVSDVASLMGKDDMTTEYTFYGIWSQSSYKVAYDATGGDPVASTFTYRWSQTGLDAHTTSKSGYTFGGWWTDEGGTGIQATSTTPYFLLVGGVEPAEGFVLKLYAHWIDNATLTGSSLSAASASSPLSEMPDDGFAADVPATLNLMDVAHVREAGAVEDAPLSEATGVQAGQLSQQAPHSFGAIPSNSVLAASVEVSSVVNDAAEKVCPDAAENAEKPLVICATAADFAGADTQYPPSERSTCVTNDFADSVLLVVTGSDSADSHVTPMQLGVEDRMSADACQLVNTGLESLRSAQSAVVVDASEMGIDQIGCEPKVLWAKEEHECAVAMHAAAQESAV